MYRMLSDKNVSKTLIPFNILIFYRPVVFTRIIFGSALSGSVPTWAKQKSMAASSSLIPTIAVFSPLLTSHASASWFRALKSIKFSMKEPIKLRSGKGVSAAWASVIKSLLSSIGKRSTNRIHVMPSVMLSRLNLVWVGQTSMSKMACLIAA